jgi:hypothetical protein
MDGDQNYEGQGSVAQAQDVVAPLLLPQMQFGKKPPLHLHPRPPFLREEPLVAPVINFDKESNAKERPPLAVEALVDNASGEIPLVAPEMPLGNEPVRKTLLLVPGTGGQYAYADKDE